MLPFLSSCTVSPGRPITPLHERAALAAVGRGLAGVLKTTMSPRDGPPKSRQMRHASTRSLESPRQPGPGFAQFSAGSIDDDGIRYGLTTQALSASDDEDRADDREDPVERDPDAVREPRKQAGERVAAVSGGRLRRGARRSRSRSRGSAVVRRLPLLRRVVAVPGLLPRGARSRPVARARPHRARHRRPATARRLALCRGSSSSQPRRSSSSSSSGRFQSQPSLTHMLPPPRSTRVVAREEHVGHAPAAELRRPRVVRVLEPAAELGGEALELARSLRRARPAAAARRRRARASRAGRRSRGRTGRPRSRPSRGARRCARRSLRSARREA